MTEIEVTGTVAKIIPPRDTYTQGQLGTARIHFTFDADWQGYTDLTAVFDSGLASADAAIINDECTVPQDVLATPYRIIQISISGNDGTNAISTAWVRLGQVLPSGTTGGGGRFVTFDELAQMLLNYVTFGDLDDYVTKTELATAIAELAKKDELDALTAAFDALVLAVDDKADKSELDKYVLKSIYDDFVQAVNDALALKANLTDVWQKSEITLVTSGDGKSFLGNDGQYHVIQGGSGDAKAFIAEYNVTTAQEIIDFIDASNEPYAPMQVKRGGSYYTVVTAVKQDTNQVIIRTFATLSGNYYMFTYTVTDGTWASSSYGFQKILESGTNIKTINGQSLLGSGNIEVQGSGVQVQANWNETDDTSPAYIQNKPTIPDVSNLATKESVQAVSDTVSTLSGTVINQGVAIQNLTNDKADKATLANYATTEYVDGNFAKAADIPDVSGFETTAHAEATFAKKSDIPDVSGFETTQHANDTFATKDALTTGLAGKVDTATLDGYETSAHADATFAKKTDVPIFAHTDTPEGAGQIKKDTWTINGETKQSFEFLRAAALSGECVYTTTDGTKCRLMTADEFEVSGVTKDELSTATDACWKKSEIGLETTGTGTLFLANDGTYKPASGDPPDLTAYLKKSEAERIYATIANHNALVDRVTAAEADIDNLETDVAALKTVQVKSVTASGFTVTPDTNGNVNVGGTDVSRTATSGSWGSEITYTIAQTLPAGASSDTKGSSLTVVKRTENSGATPRTTMTVDGVQLATSADVPDVSLFATTEYVQNTFETLAHASATYETKEDASKVKTVKAGEIITSVENGGIQVGRTFVTYSGQGTPGNLGHVISVFEIVPVGTSDGSIVYTGEAGSGISFHMSENGTELTSFQISFGTRSGKFSLPTMKWVSDTFAAKTDIITVTDGDGTQFLANDGTYKTVQITPPDLTPYLTKSEAGETYATKSALDEKADRTQLQGYLTRVEASETYETIARASKIKSLTAAGHAVTVTDEGLANVGGTKVTKTSASPQIGVSNVSLSVQQILPATEDSTTGEGETLPITYTATTSGALTEYSNFTIDGVQIATNDDLTAAVSPIKSIKVDKFNVLTPDENGQVTTGRTPVAISQSTSEGITNYCVGIYEDLPGGVAGPGEGSALSITYKANDTELTSFAIKSGANLTTGTSYELPTMKWVREYIDALDANNTGY